MASSRILRDPRALELVTSAYGPAFFDREEALSHGDKIILHESFVHKLVGRFPHNRMPTPLIFEIKNAKSRRVSHCGVLEFTAPRQCAILPQWMMQNLCLHDGDTVSLRLRQLPKAQFVKFQPVQHSFTELPDPKHTLEFALRSFTALTVGDCIVIRHGDQQYQLNVREVKGERDPCTAVCVVDTSVEVDFDAPVETKEQEPSVQDLRLGSTVSGSVGADQYAYYKLHWVDPNAAIKVSMRVVAGDPDFYISTARDKPSIQYHTWSSHDPTTERSPERVRSLVIGSFDPKFITGVYYISVNGLRAPAEFELTVDEVSPKPQQESSAKTLQSTRDAAVAEPGSQRCENCRNFVPSKQYEMHMLQCTRHNWFCPECDRVIRRVDKEKHAHCPKCHAAIDKDELEKHHLIAHAKFPCECGQEFERSDIEQHKSEACPKRLSPCSWCQVRLPFDQLGEHEEYCKGKSIPCERCGKPVPRSRMVIHNAAEHNVNPCIEDSDMFRNVPLPGARISSGPSTRRPSGSSTRSGDRIVGEWANAVDLTGTSDGMGLFRHLDGLASALAPMGTMWSFDRGIGAREAEPRDHSDLDLQRALQESLSGSREEPSQRRPERISADLSHGPEDEALEHAIAASREEHARIGSSAEASGLGPSAPAPQDNVFASFARGEDVPVSAASPLGYMIEEDTEVGDWEDDDMDVAESHGRASSRPARRQRDVIVVDDSDSDHRDGDDMDVVVQEGPTHSAGEKKVLGGSSKSSSSAPREAGQQQSRSAGESVGAQLLPDDEVFPCPYCERLLPTHVLETHIERCYQEHTPPE